MTITFNRSSEVFRDARLHTVGVSKAQVSARTIANVSRKRKAHPIVVRYGRPQRVGRHKGRRRSREGSRNSKRVHGASRDGDENVQERIVRVCRKQVFLERQYKSWQRSDDVMWIGPSTTFHRITSICEGRSVRTITCPRISAPSPVWVCTRHRLFLCRYRTSGRCVVERRPRKLKLVALVRLCGPSRLHQDGA